jgi:hypothetical protein
MRHRMQSMSTAEMDRFPSNEGDPLENLLAPEENHDQTRAADYEAAVKEILRPRVEEELKEMIERLNCEDRGDLAAYWIVVCRYSSKDVAKRFGQKPGTIRVAQCRALKRHPCGKPGACAAVPGCAHQRGRVIWDRIVTAIVFSFRRCRAVPISAARRSRIAS